MTEEEALTIVSGAAASGAADVGKHLIDKIGSAVGFSVMSGKRKNFEEANETYINGIKADESLSPLKKAAYISCSREIIKKYCNQVGIVAKALNEIPRDAHPEKVDDEWLSRFMDFAKHVSNQEVQLMWGKLLANECTTPGTVPKKLIHILSLMSPETANHFNILCKFVMGYGDRPVPVIEYKNDFFKRQGLNYLKLLDLADLGLIIFDGRGHSIRKLAVKLTYFDMQIDIIPPKRCPIGNALFTEAGQCLYKTILPAQAPDEYLKVCTAFWKKMNCKVKITSKNSD